MLFMSYFGGGGGEISAKVSNFCKSFKTRDLRVLTYGSTMSLLPRVTIVGSTKI